MREKSDICPICNQYRKLRSINNLYDRIRGITIAYHIKPTDYLCYPCRNKIGQGIKEGKIFTQLQGSDRVLSGYGLLKYMDKVKKELSFDFIILKKAVGFIDSIYSKWIEIDSVDKIKYHFASLYVALHNDDKRKQLEEFIKNRYTNIYIEELKEKVEEINNWCNKLSFNPYDSIS